MTEQIAVRIPTLQLKDLDSAVASGHFKNRAEAVRRGIELLLRQERERQIAEEYRRAYGAKPAEEWVGEAGLEFGGQILSSQ